MLFCSELLHLTCQHGAFQHSVRQAAKMPLRIEFSDGNRGAGQALWGFVQWDLMSHWAHAHTAYWEEQKHKKRM